MQTGLRIIETYSCSKRCKFCYQKVHNSIILTPYKLRHAIKELGNWNPSYVTIMGGEVSEYPKETEELLKVIQESYAFVAGKSLTTNGDGDENWYKSLWRYGVNNITFSGVENIDKAVRIGQSPNTTVRLNCFLDASTVGAVIIKASKENIPLALCSDLRENQQDKELIDIVRHACNPTSIKIYGSYIIFYLEKYTFWLFKHNKGYTCDNNIILPNGTLTTNYLDFINCKGAS